MTKIYKSKYRFINDGNNRGFLVHVAIAEKALGRKMPKGVEIHHVDENGLNNDHSNLVICPDRAYHKLLHVRTNALNACGNANWLRCVRCGNYDDPKKMRLYIPKDQKSPYAEHAKCANAYKRDLYNARKSSL